MRIITQTVVFMEDQAHSRRWNQFDHKGLAYPEYGFVAKSCFGFRSLCCLERACSESPYSVVTEKSILSSEEHKMPIQKTDGITGSCVLGFLEQKSVVCRISVKPLIQLTYSFDRWGAVAAYAMRRQNKGMVVDGYVKIFKFDEEKRYYSP